MCGIAGIFRYNEISPPFTETELLSISDSMVSRGPDSSGIWISDNKTIGLAHRRLSIIDLSPTGSQPMHSKDSLNQIVFNGEIYNYRELKANLIKKGYQFRSQSDTEVLLYLYEEMGPEMVHSLRGMFAFAIWDDRKKGLFLARDHFGIKPLFYSNSRGTLRFASQVKALLAGGSIQTSPDPAGQIGFFLLGSVPEPHTFYKEIRSLPSGSTLWVDYQGNQNLNKYFSVQDEYAKPGTEEFNNYSIDLSEQLREGLLSSVRYHLVSDVPVGIFLSSGLDSTTLLALASEVSSSELQTVTLKFKEYIGTNLDESPLAESVSQYYNSTHKTYQITSDDLNSNFKHIFESMDQPSIDGINTYFISKVAAKMGLKTALSGVGADEIFGGYSSFIDIPKLVKTAQFIPYANKIGKLLRLVSAPILKYFTSPKYAGLLEYGSTYGRGYLLRRGLFMPWELPEFLDPDFVSEGWEKLQPIINIEETAKNIDSTFLKVSALEMEWYMRNQLLRDADWAGMSHSVEIRTPFVDIELFKNISHLHRKNFSPDKLIMAGTPRKPVPKSILNKPKTGFSIPTYQWFNQYNSNEPSGPRTWAKKVYQMHAEY